jgi:Bacteriophage head to tail connecting protein
MYKNKRQELELLRAQLDNERSSFIQHWRDLSDNILPRRSRFTLSDVNKGDKRNQKIIDSTATLASRTLSSGMMSGVTSPARPWFRLTTPDPDVAEYGPVKEWLYLVGQRMSTSFLRSNIYNILPIVYKDLGVFGTAPMAIEEDLSGDVFTCQSFPVGSYMIAKDYKGRVNTFMREFRMTIRQVVEQFGQRVNGKYDWSNFSETVKSLYERGHYEQWVDVVHCIRPNNEWDPQKLNSKFKKFSSCYYERGSQGTSSSVDVQHIGGIDSDKFLSEKGYDYFPVLCPRWETTGEDVYGTDCPGMTALGDIKQLQTGEKRILQAVDKMVNPPMVAPTSMRNQKMSLLPGDITFGDVREGSGGFRPAHQVELRIQEMEMKQDQVRDRIRRSFFEDLFLMLASSNRTQITAREIEERHEEKLLALGPVLEQLNQDLLDPLIDIAFDIHIKQGLIPPPPEELQGADLKVEYISIMAQAQKMIGIGGVERFTGFVGQLAAVNPQVLDKINFDQAVDVYADMTSIPPSIVKTDDDVEAMRGERAQAEAKAQQMQMIQQGAMAAKDLSGAKTDEENALTSIARSAEAGNLVGGM